MLQCSALMAWSGLRDGTTATGRLGEVEQEPPSSDAHRPKTRLLQPTSAPRAPSLVGTTKLTHAEAIVAGELTSQELTGPSLCAVHRRDPAETRAQKQGWRNNLNRRMLPLGRDLVCSFDAGDRALHWAGWLAETYTELPAWQNQGTQSDSVLDRRHGWVGILFEC